MVLYARKKVHGAPLRIFITYGGKLLNADWLRQGTFFLSHEGTVDYRAEQGKLQENLLLDSDSDEPAFFHTYKIHFKHYSVDSKDLLN